MAKFVDIQDRLINPRHIWDIEVKQMTTIFVVNLTTPNGKFYKSFDTKDGAWEFVSEILNCW
jgi:hypothetical protein